MGININFSVVLYGYGLIESYWISSILEFIWLGNILCLSLGNYIIDIILLNFVIFLKVFLVVIMFIERILELFLSFNLVVRIGFFVLFFVIVFLGLDVKIFWDYGDGRDSESYNRGFGK